MNTNSKCEYCFFSRNLIIIHEYHYQGMLPHDSPVM